MGILKTAKNFLARKALQTIGLTEHSNQFISLTGNNFSWGNQSADYLKNAYGGNPYVFMVIDRIVQRMVQIDTKLIGKGDKEVEDVEFEELLNNPNEKDDRSSFLRRAGATLLATGQCFVVRVETIGEKDSYIVPVNSNVTINEDVRGNVIDYTVSTFGYSQRYLKNEVLHISNPDITRDTNNGLSTLEPLRKVWESNNEVWASEASLHKNKGIAGVLHSKGGRPMTYDEQSNLQKKYDSDYTGLEKFGKVKVSTAQLGYIQMGMNPNDLKSIETRIEHLRTICAAFNVDSKLFGDPASSTYNNMAEAQRAFIMNAVIPLSKILLPQIVGFIAKSMFRDYSMILDEDTIAELQLTKDQRSERVVKEVKNGILSSDQAREMLYPDLVKDADNNSQDTEEDGNEE